MTGRLGATVLATAVALTIVLIIQNDGASVHDNEACGGAIRIDLENYVKFESIGLCRHRRFR